MDHPFTCGRARWRLRLSHLCNADMLKLSYHFAPSGDRNFPSFSMLPQFPAFLSVTVSSSQVILTSLSVPFTQQETLKSTGYLILHPRPILEPGTYEQMSEISHHPDEWPSTCLGQKHPCLAYHHALSSCTVLWSPVLLGSWRE